jgi:hypothetical protein
VTLRVTASANSHYLTEELTQLLSYQQSRDNVGTPVGFRPGSHVSHFLGRARSGIVFAVGKTQVY